MPDPNAPGNEARAKNASYLYGQAKLMWDDQVEYAETLRDKRKLYSTGLALIAGLGVFRINWFRRADEISIVQSDVALVLIQLLLMATGALLVVSGYLLFTERPNLRPWIAKLSKTSPIVKPVRSRRSAIGRLCRHQFRAALISSRRRGRATEWLMFDLQEAERVVEMLEHEALIWTTLKLNTARENLVVANNRVNSRISKAVLFMGAAFLCLAFATLWYTLSLGVVRHG